MALLGAGGCAAFFSITAFAQLSMTVVLPNGTSLPITSKNRTRPNNAIILYSSQYGKTTGTNPYGVEVTAVPVTNKDNGNSLYEVQTQSNVWQCQADTSLQCGNARIPQNGIVLSATGDKRQFVLNALKPGTRFVLQNTWFQQARKKATVIDPTVSSNPIGSGYPGFRASNQLIAYTPQYGRRSTQTNEFGFEVTVRNGVVTAHEGSDSMIPKDGFVLSGHGKAREWLIRNAPLGAKVSLDKPSKLLTLGIDFGTYVFQFDQQWQRSYCHTASTEQHAGSKKQLKPSFKENCSALKAKRDRAAERFHLGDPQSAVETMQDALSMMAETLWLSHEPFETTTLRGVWHRPVEKTPKAIAETLDRLKESGINAVFLETFFHGYTIFPSKTFEAYGLPKQYPKFGELDILGTWITLAHQRNMKIHTWFQTFYVGSKVLGSPGPILTAYPAWANVQFSALVPKQIVVNAYSNGFMAGTVQEKPGREKFKQEKQNEAQASDETKAPLTPPYSNVLNTKPTGENKPNTNKPNNENKKNQAEVQAKQVFLSQLNQSLPSAATPPEGKEKGTTVIRLESPRLPVASSLENGAYFLDPANPSAKVFIQALIKELVTEYDIDGFQYDYIRYPASFASDRYNFKRTTWGYSPVSRRAFEEQFGIDPATINPSSPNRAVLWARWNQYKTGLINNFVSETTAMIRTIKPDVLISAAVFPKVKSARQLKHQDWPTWGKNNWVDCFTPMTLTSALKVIHQDTDNMIGLLNHEIPVYSGLFGPFNNNSPEHILAQIQAAKQSGASGYVLFDSAHLMPPALQALKVSQRNTGLYLPAASSKITGSQADSEKMSPEKERQSRRASKQSSKKTKRGWWIFRF
ncbi:MAG: family 10 glycosylhydrolase [Cyanobacteria bacterium P01_H01_bin.74]